MFERLNGWGKILITMIPLVISAGVVWGNMDTDVDTLKRVSDTTILRVEKLQDATVALERNQAIAQEQLRQILEMTKEIKEDMKDLKRKIR